MCEVGSLGLSWLLEGMTLLFLVINDVGIRGYFCHSYVLYFGENTIYFQLKRIVLDVYYQLRGKRGKRLLKREWIDYWCVVL